MKNNIGEAILLAAIIFSCLNFDLNVWQLGILIGIALIPILTWNYTDSGITDRANDLEIERRKLENKKLELEIERLEQELNKGERNAV